MSEVNFSRNNFKKRLNGKKQDLNDLRNQQFRNRFDLEMDVKSGGNLSETRKEEIVKK